MFILMFMRCKCSPTCEWAAGHSCILGVQAVVLPPWTFRALVQSKLIACATYLVQPYTVRTLAKMCLAPCPCYTASNKSISTKEFKFKCGEVTETRCKC